VPVAEEDCLRSKLITVQGQTDILQIILRIILPWMTRQGPSSSVA
jgi:hypothetical protein